MYAMIRTITKLTKRFLSIAAVVLSGALISPLGAQAADEDLNSYADPTPKWTDNTKTKMQVRAFYFTVLPDNCLSLTSCAIHEGLPREAWQWDCEPFQTGKLTLDGTTYTWTEIGPEAMSRENAPYWWELPPVPSIISFPETLRIIGKEAFAKVSSVDSMIEQMILPASIDSIADSAFAFAFKAPTTQGDPSTCKNTLLLKGGKIGRHAFEGNNFKTLTLKGTPANPLNLKSSMGRMDRTRSAFNQSNVYDLDISKNVYVGVAQFSNMSTFNSVTIDSDTIPQGCFENSGFSESAPDKKMTIGADVVRINDHAFNMFKSLPNIRIHGACNYIGEEAFSETDVVSLLIEEGFRGQIAEGAFDLNPTLKKAEVYCETIGDYAFAFCEGLETVVLGAQVKNVGVQAFEECRAIKDIYLGVMVDPSGLNPMVPFCHTNAFTSAGYDNGTEYIQQPGWRDTSEYADDLTPDYTTLRVVDVHVTPVFDSGGGKLRAFTDEAAFNVCHLALEDSRSGYSPENLYKMQAAAHEVDSLRKQGYTVRIQFPSGSDAMPPATSDSRFKESGSGSFYVVVLETGGNAYYHQGFDRGFDKSYYCYTNPLKGYDQSLPEADYLCYRPTEYNIPGGTVGHGVPLNMGNFRYCKATEAQDSITDSGYFPKIKDGTTSSIPTGIKSLPYDDPLTIKFENGEPVIPEGAAIYTIDGMEASAGQLHPGIYIVRLGSQSTKILIH